MSRQMKLRSRSRTVPEAVAAAPTEMSAVPQSTATAEMREQCELVWTTNKAKNKLGRQETAAKKTLNKQMVKGEVEQFAINVDGTEVEAVIEEKDEEYLDVNILVSMVDPETFMKIVTATKGAVAEHCGDNVVIACTKTRTKPAALQIRKVAE